MIVFFVYLICTNIVYTTYENKIHEMTISEYYRRHVNGKKYDYVFKLNCVELYKNGRESIPYLFSV